VREEEFYIQLMATAPLRSLLEAYLALMFDVRNQNSVEESKLSFK